MDSLQLLEVIKYKHLHPDYSESYTHQEFLDKYALVMAKMGIEPSRDTKAKCEAVSTILGLAPRDLTVGKKRVWMGEGVWRDFEDHLRTAELDARRRRKEGVSGDENTGGESGISIPKAPFMMGSSGPRSAYSDDAGSMLSAEDEAGRRHGVGDDGGSVWGGGATDSVGGGSVIDDLELKYGSGRGWRADREEVLRKEAEEAEAGAAAAAKNVTISPVRRKWVCFTWSVTWCIPNCCLSHCGGMKRKDVQMAWREKVALCLIILFMCGFLIFFIGILGVLLCPKQHVYTHFEVQSHGSDNDAYMSVRGEVFDITNYPDHHGVTYKEIKDSNKFFGQDASSQFPLQVSQLCDGADGRGIDYSVSLQNYTKVD